MLWPELVHCGPLGACPLAAGSVLLEFCNMGRWGHHPTVTTWKDKLGIQLADAYNAHRKYLRDHAKTSTRRTFAFGRLSMHNKSDKPELKTEASNCLAVCDWLAEECRKVAGRTGTGYDRDRATMMWGLSTFFWVVRRSPRWLESNCNCPMKRRTHGCSCITSCALSQSKVGPNCTH